MSHYYRRFIKKYKNNGEIEFRPVYFKSVTKTVSKYLNSKQITYLN